MRFTAILSTLVSLVLLADAAKAQDVQKGLALSKENCARCHDISAEGQNKTYPRSFASIAAFRDQGQIHSRIVFPQLHSQMPQMIYMLSSGAIDDLIAYIVSLDRTAE